MLAGRGVEVDAGDVLRELVELVEQLPQPVGAGRAAMGDIGAQPRQIGFEHFVQRDAAIGGAQLE